MLFVAWREGLDFLQTIIEEHFIEFGFLIIFLVICGFSVFKFLRRKKTPNNNEVKIKCPNCGKNLEIKINGNSVLSKDGYSNLESQLCRVEIIEGSSLGTEEFKWANHSNPLNEYDEIFEAIFDDFQNDAKQLYRQFFVEPSEKWDTPSVAYHLQTLKIRLSLIMLEQILKLSHLKLIEDSVKDEERNPADTSIVLVELLADVGDLLSEYQDKVAEEAYLDSARIQNEIKKLKKEFVNKRFDKTKIDLKRELNGIREKIKKFFSDTEQILRKKND